MCLPNVRAILDVFKSQFDVMRSRPLFPCQFPCQRQTCYDACRLIVRRPVIRAVPRRKRKKKRHFSLIAGLLELVSTGKSLIVFIVAF